MKILNKALYLSLVFAVVLLSFNFKTANAATTKLYYQDYDVWKAQSLVNKNSVIAKSVKTTINKYNKTETSIYDGLKITVPKEWILDSHASGLYLRFYTKSLKVDLMSQPLSRPPYKKISYTTYKNDYLSSVKKYITSTSKKKIGNKTYDIVQIKRPSIDKKDVNTLYVNYFLAEKDYVRHIQFKGSYTTWKSKQMEIEKSIKTLIYSKPIKPKKIIPTSSTTVKKVAGNKTLEIKKDQLLPGIFLPKAYDIDNFEKQYGKFGAQMIYKPINSLYDPFIKTAINKNKVPIISLLLVESNRKEAQPIQKIISGKYDQYLKNWAVNIKPLKGTVLLRVGNEMNGNWSAWGPKSTFNDPDLYARAMRHIVTLFRENGANNIMFVFNPNGSSDPYYLWNDPIKYYPGDDANDWIGMTGYNFGKNEWGNAQTFKQIFDPVYTHFTTYLGTAKPYSISETGSVEIGGNKAQFINDVFNSNKRYKNVKMALYFNEKHGKYDFRVSTTKKSTDSIKSVLKSKHLVKGLR